MYLLWNNLIAEWSITLDKDILLHIYDLLQYYSLKMSTFKWGYNLKNVHTIKWSMKFVSCDKLKCTWLLCLIFFVALIDPRFLLDWPPINQRMGQKQKSKRQRKRRGMSLQSFYHFSATLLSGISWISLFLSLSPCLSTFHSFLFLPASLLVVGL